MGKPTDYYKAYILLASALLKLFENIEAFALGRWGVADFET